MAQKIVIDGILDFDATESIKKIKTQLENSLSSITVGLKIDAGDINPQIEKISQRIKNIPIDLDINLDRLQIIKTQFKTLESIDSILNIKSDSIEQTKQLIGENFSFFETKLHFNVKESIENARKQIEQGFSNFRVATDICFKDCGKTTSKTDNLENLNILKDIRREINKTSTLLSLATFKVFESGFRSLEGLNKLSETNDKLESVNKTIKNTPASIKTAFGSDISNLITSLRGLPTQLNTQITASASGIVGPINTALQSLPDSLNAEIKTLLGAFNGRFSEFTSSINTEFNTLSANFKATINSAGTNIKDSIDRLLPTINQLASTFESGISKLPATLFNTTTTVADALSLLSSNFRIELARLTTNLKQEITRLSRDIGAITTESVGRLRATFDSMVATLTTSVGVFESRFTDITRNLATISTRLTDLFSDFSPAINEFKEQLLNLSSDIRDRFTEITGTLSETTDRITAELTSLTRNFSDIISELPNTFGNKINDSVSILSTENTRLAENYGDTIDGISDSLLAANEQLTLGLGSELDRVTDTFSRSTTTLVDSVDESVAFLSNEFNRNVERLTSGLSDENTRLLANYTENINNISSTILTASDQLTLGLGSELDRLTDTFSRSTTTLVDSVDESVAFLSNEFNRNIENLITGLSDDNTRLLANYTNTINSANDSILAASDQLILGLGSELDKLTESFSRSTTTLVDSVNESVAFLSNEFNRNVERLTSELSTSINSFDTELQTVAGLLPGIRGVIEDLNQNIRVLNSALQSAPISRVQALTDPVTGTINRAAVMSDLKKMKQEGRLEPGFRLTQTNEILVNKLRELEAAAPTGTGQTVGQIIPNLATILSNVSTSLQSASEILTQTIQNEIQTLVNTLRENLTNLTSTLQTDVNRNVAALETLNNELKAKLEQVVENLRIGLDDPLAGIRGEISTINTSLEGNLNRIISEFKINFNKLITELSTQITSLTRSLRTSLDAPIGIIRSELNTLSTTLNQRLNELIAEITGRLNALIVGQRAEMKTLVSELQIKLKELITSTENSLDGPTTTTRSELPKITTSLGELEQTLSGRLNALIVQQTADQATLTAMFTLKLNDLISAISKPTSILNDRLNLLISLLEINLRTISDTFNDRFIEIITGLDSRLGILTAELEGNLSDLSPILEKRINVLITALENKLNVITDAFNKRFNAITITLTTSIDKLTGSFKQRLEVLIAILRDNLGTLAPTMKNELVRITTTLDQSTSQITTQLKLSLALLSADVSIKLERLTDAVTIRLIDLTSSLEDRFDALIRNQSTDFNSIVRTINDITATLEFGFKLFSASTEIKMDRMIDAFSSRLIDVAEILGTALNRLTTVQSTDLKTLILSLEMKLSGIIDTLTTKFDEPITALKSELSLLTASFEIKIGRVSNSVQEGLADISGVLEVQMIDFITKMKTAINFLTSALEIKLHDIIQTLTTGFNKPISDIRAELNTLTAILDTRLQKLPGKIESAFETLANKLDKRFDTLIASIKGKFDDLIASLSRSLSALNPEIEKITSSIDQNIKSVTLKLDNTIEILTTGLNRIIAALTQQTTSPEAQIRGEVSAMTRSEMKAEIRRFKETGDIEKEFRMTQGNDIFREKLIEIRKKSAVSTGDVPDFSNLNDTLGRLNTIIESLPRQIESSISALPGRIETVVQSASDRIILIINRLPSLFEVALNNIVDNFKAGTDNAILQSISELSTKIEAKFSESLATLETQSNRLLEFQNTIQDSLSLVGTLNNISLTVGETTTRIFQQLENNLAAFRTLLVESLEQPTQRIKQLLEEISTTFEGLHAAINNISRAEPTPAAKTKLSLTTTEVSQLNYRDLQAILKVAREQQLIPQETLLNQNTEALKQLYLGLQATANAILRTSASVAKQVSNPPPPTTPAASIQPFGEIYAQARAAAEESDQIGRLVLEGIIEGMKAGESNAEGTIRSIAQAIIKGLRDEFEIQSPSKKTKRLGNWIGLGLIKGIKEGLTHNPFVDFNNKIIKDIKNFWEIRSASKKSKLLGFFVGQGWVQGINNSIRAGFGKIKETIEKPFEILRIGGAALVGYFAAQFLDFGSAIAVLQDSLRRFSEFETFNQTIMNTASSAQQGTAALKLLRDESDRLKVSYSASIQGLAQLQAATQNTSAATLVPDLTIGLLQSSRVYNLSAEQLDRANTAIAQSFSKGIVSQEELRGQLSEALPNALGVASRAYGVSTQELNKMIEAGELSSVFFAKFAKQLKAETAITAARSVGTLSSSLTDLNNQWQLLQVSLINTLAPIIKIIVDGGASISRFLAENTGYLKLLGIIIGGMLLNAFVSLIRIFSSFIVECGKIILTLTGLTDAAQHAKKFIDALGYFFTGNSKKAAEFGGRIQALGKAVSELGEALRLSIVAILPALVFYLLSEVIGVFIAWADAGKETRQSIEALNKAILDSGQGINQYANSLNAAAENAQKFKDELPGIIKVADAIVNFFGGKDPLKNLFMNRTIVEQQNLLQTVIGQTRKAQDDLNRAATENISAKNLEKSIELLTMGKTALEQERFLTVELNADKQKQLEIIDITLSKLKKQLDLANGITTTFGRISSLRSEMLAKLAENESRNLTELSVLQEKGVLDQQQVEKAKLQFTQARIEGELAAQRKALEQMNSMIKATRKRGEMPSDKLIAEQKKTEAEVTKLVRDGAEARMAVRKFEQEQAIKELDKQIKSIEDFTNEKRNAKALEIQKAFNENKISAERLAQLEQILDTRTLEVKKANLLEEIQLTREANDKAAIAAAKKALANNKATEKQKELAKQTAIGDEEAATRMADLKTKLADLELEKAKQIGEAIKKRLEEQKTLRNDIFEQEKSFLQQVIDLEEARNKVLSARDSIQITRDELSVARLERARDIVRQLNDDDNLTSEERINLRRELSQLGINGATSVLNLTQQIADLEYSIIEQKSKAQKIENEQALKRLMIEEKIASITNQQNIIAAQEKVISAKQEVLGATPENKELALQKLKLAEDALNLATEKSLAEMNRLRTEELAIQQQISEEQQRQNDLFKKLDLQRNISESKTETGRRLQTALPATNQNYVPDFDAINKLVAQLQAQNSRQPQSSANIFNITAPPGFDGKDLGREFAKSNERLQRELFKI